MRGAALPIRRGLLVALTLMVAMACSGGPERVGAVRDPRPAAPVATAPTPTPSAAPSGAAAAPVPQATPAVEARAWLDESRWQGAIVMGSKAFVAAGDDSVLCSRPANAAVVCRRPSADEVTHIVPSGSRTTPPFASPPPFPDGPREALAQADATTGEPIAMPPELGAWAASSIGRRIVLRSVGALRLLATSDSDPGFGDPGVLCARVGEHTACRESSRIVDVLAIDTLASPTGERRWLVYFEGDLDHGSETGFVLVRERAGGVDLSFAPDSTVYFESDGTGQTLVDATVREHAIGPEVVLTTRIVRTWDATLRQRRTVTRHVRVPEDPDERSWTVGESGLNE